MSKTRESSTVHNSRYFIIIQNSLRSLNVDDLKVKQIRRTEPLMSQELCILQIESWKLKVNSPQLCIGRERYPMVVGLGNLQGLP